jgi:predicted HAD superfamily Cof-like phosphohydrolase
MEIEQAHVKLFMVKADQVLPDRPTLPTMQVRIARLRFLAEELAELANAWGVEFSIDNEDGATDHFSAEPVSTPLFPNVEDAITEAYDASIDLTVFALGNNLAMGADTCPGWLEVHRSNMSKFIDGHKREDGKWIKGPSYSPANLAPIIRAQIEAAEGRDRQLLLG